MRPLTDDVPKPLLTAGGRRLIEWQIEALARAGMCELVVNVAHLADAFEPALGRGAAYGVTLAYSREGERAEDALETLGGIVRALPLLGGDPFVVVSGDIVTDFDYATAGRALLRDSPRALPMRTWCWSTTRRFMRKVTWAWSTVSSHPTPWSDYTYANIGVFAPQTVCGSVACSRAPVPVALLRGARRACHRRALRRPLAQRRHPGRTRAARRRTWASRC